MGATAKQINLKNLNVMKKTLKLMAALFVGAMFMGRPRHHHG